MARHDRRWLSVVTADEDDIESLDVQRDSQTAPAPRRSLDFISQSRPSYLLRWAKHPSRAMTHVFPPAARYVFCYFEPLSL